MVLFMDILGSISVFSRSFSLFLFLSELSLALLSRRLYSAGWWACTVNYNNPPREYYQGAIIFPHQNNFPSWALRPSSAMGFSTSPGRNCAKTMLLRQKPSPPPESIRVD